MQDWSNMNRRPARLGRFVPRDLGLLVGQLDAPIASEPTLHACLAVETDFKACVSLSFSANLWRWNWGTV